MGYNNGNRENRILRNKAEYQRIMGQEDKLAKKCWQIPPVNEIFKTVEQLHEIAESSSVLRSYNGRYGLTSNKIAYESVGAHSNLCCAILDRCLSYLYGPTLYSIPDGYTYRELMEVIRRHDLPENVIGDIPDNGAGDADTKRKAEMIYFQHFKSLSPFREYEFEDNVNRLLIEMDNQTSFIGKLLYLADKTSALIITLWHDQKGRYPLMSPDSPAVSGRDRAEMKLCDYDFNGHYRASEMWAIDFFKMRNLTEYDDTGYYTALIVAYTLEVNGCWYKWREKDYI